jgi:hypothetical protein
MNRFFVDTFYSLVSRFFVLGDERQRAAPRQRDMARASRESRYKTGIFPTPWGTPDLAINHEEPENTRPLACRKRETIPHMVRD